MQSRGAPSRVFSDGRGRGPRIRFAGILGWTCVRKSRTPEVGAIRPKAMPAILTEVVRAA